MLLVTGIRGSVHIPSSSQFAWHNTKSQRKRPSVHHKHAFSRSGAIKGAECLHGLVQCVAMRD